MSAALLYQGSGPDSLDVARGKARAPTNAQLERKRRYRSRFAALRAEYEGNAWKSHHQELAKWIQPRRGRFEIEQTGRGSKLNPQILDATATYALRDLTYGMMSGNTSQARQWFRLVTQDPDLNNYGPVEDWLYVLQQGMEQIFQLSNWYGFLPGVYESIGLTGTAAGLHSAHPERVIHCEEFECGSYYLATDEYGDVDTCYRTLRMTARQVGRKFGEDALSGPTRAALQGNHPNQWVDVIHAIEPNDLANPESAYARHKPWASCWFEVNAGDETGFLRESGFDAFPVLAPRWWRTGSDVYGRSPGMDALPDVKQLQQEQRQKLEGIEILVKPPTVAKGITHVKTVPGGVTQVTDLEHGFRAAYQITLPLGELREDIQQTQERIRTGFFSDLFRMISQLEGQFTAFEIAARQEEKLMLIGPVLDSVHNDLLSPGIDRTFERMMERGLLPPPPPELEGQQLKVEYISILAQAQRAIGMSSMDRVLTSVTTIAPIHPPILDKFDFDAYLDEAAQKLGLPPKLIRGAEQVEQLRAQRQAAQLAAQVAAAAPGLAKGVKDLAGAPLDQGENALTRALNTLGGPQ